MSFKSPTQPFCRYCGVPLKKRTETLYFGCAAIEVERFGDTHRSERPTTRAEAQRLANMQIVSIRYSTTASENAGIDTKVVMGREIGSGRMMTRSIAVPRYIRRVTVWDGESYEDEFFCSNDHAQRFAYAAARAGMAMPAYNQAVQTRKVG